MAASEQDRQGGKTDVRVGNERALPRESTQKGRVRGHSRDHTTIMQLEESQKATDDGGRPGSSRFRTKSGDRHGNWVTSPRRTRLKLVDEISPILLPVLADSGGCAGLVGADVVKNSGHE